MLLILEVIGIEPARTVAAYRRLRGDIPINAEYNAIPAADRQP